jgi:hypothetical protein
MINITERLDNLRHALRLTWKELAAHLGVSYVVLHYIRVGKRPISAKLEHRIRQAEEEMAGQSPQSQKSKPEIVREHDFNHLEWLDSLKRRWKRRSSDRNEITLAVRVLFPSHADEMLRWLKKK